MTVSERLFMTMDSQKLRAIDLASILNVNASVISMWKKRNTSPPTDYLLQICEFLGVTVNYLLTGESEAKPEAPLEENDFDSPFYDSLTEDERELLSSYAYLSDEGKRWVRHIIKEYLKGNENLSSSRQHGAKHSGGQTA